VAVAGRVVDAAVGDHQPGRPRVPAVSVATPEVVGASLTLVVSKETEKGREPSVEIVVHEPPPRGGLERNRVAPEPSVSLALALRVIVWRKSVPGSVRAAVGAAVSDLAHSRTSRARRCRVVGTL